MRPAVAAPAAGLLLLLGGCAAGGQQPLAMATAAVPTSAVLSAASFTAASAPAIPTATVSAIQAAIDAVNATAGGTPAGQRAVLQQLVDPARAQDQQRCAAAKTTVRFEPAWEDLRADPNGAAQTYVLPTLIRIYTADRVTGTDVTSLVIRVSGRRAQLSPLCVS